MYPRSRILRRSRWTRVRLCSPVQTFSERERWSAAAEVSRSKKSSLSIRKVAFAASLRGSEKSGLRGPSVTLGYWGRQEQTAQTFTAFLADSGAGPFLRTGDLGFLQDGELFVTGRLKDLIILDGRNLYPHDIERSVEASHPAVRPGCCIAFSVDQGEVEQLIVVAEIERTFLRPAAGGPAVSQELQSLRKAIRCAVSEKHEASIAQLVLVRPASLPKTPSGKHQRRACREAFLQGTLQDIHAGAGAAAGAPDDP